MKRPLCLLLAGLLLLLSACGGGEGDILAEPPQAADNSPVEENQAAAGDEQAETENSGPTADASQPMEETPEAQSADYTLSYPITVDGGRQLSLTLYGRRFAEQGFDSYGISQIEVYTNEGTLLQSISMEEVISAEDPAPLHPRYTNAWTEDGGLSIGDMNFDGAEDVGLMAWVTAGANLPYYYWLWDSEAEQFIYAFCLCNLVVDEENHQLVSETREGGGEYAANYYQYDENGQLQNVRRVVQRYDAETGETVTEEYGPEELENML